MKCFFPFKSKSKQTESKSAPELRNSSDSLTSALERGTKSSSSLPSPKSIPELYKEKEQNLIAFPFQELRDSTNGFSRSQKVGEGGFGSVYKGTIKPKNGKGSPIFVAIKKLNAHSLQVPFLSSSTLTVWLTYQLFFLFFFHLVFLHYYVVGFISLGCWTIVMVALNGIIFWSEKSYCIWIVNYYSLFLGLNYS